IDITTNDLRENDWLLELIYVLIRHEPPVDSRNTLIATLSNYYKGNAGQEAVIKKFSDEYSPEKAIWWYTRDTFIYRLLNKALRQMNVEGILPFHFFIRDLYNQLEQEHQKFQSNIKTPIKVYRGQIITRSELERLNDLSQMSDNNNYISLTSLISTTLDQSVALLFIESRKSNDECDLKSVLFEIDIDLRKKTRPFADIADCTQFPDEKEVLMMP
ncbi:unnamed protein product, partial [Didymodactylos carnosus]